MYADTITEADELFLTQVVGDFHCTKFFPPYQAEFRLATKTDDQEDGRTTYRFETWQRSATKPNHFAQRHPEGSTIASDLR